MKAILSFTIETEYIQTGYKELRAIAIDQRSIGNSKFLWTFPLQVIERVIELTGKPIEFGDEQITKLIPYVPMLNQRVNDKSRKKGEGYFKIIHKAPKLFIVETIRNKKITRMKVPTECIIAAWRVISKQPMNKEVKSRTIAENICKELQIDRFNRGDSGSFDFDKFFGCRGDYYRYFYAPIKVLQSENAIIHHTDGHIERNTESWDIQTMFDEVVICA